MSTQNEESQQETVPNADLPVLEGWVGVGGAARILGTSRQHAFRLFKARRLGSLRRVPDSHTVLVSVAELEHLKASREK